jgi:hypothetical protein
LKAQDWFPHNPDAHGVGGPLSIEPAPAYPIADCFFEFFQDKGLPYRPDMFSSGETANSCSHAMRSTFDGSPTTAADYITKDMERPNVTIVETLLSTRSSLSVDPTIRCEPRVSNTWTTAGRDTRLRPSVRYYWPVVVTTP